MTVDQALEPFGGREKHGSIKHLADAIGEPLSTVHSWVTKGKIPSWRWSQIEAAHTARRDLEGSGVA